MIISACDRPEVILPIVTVQDSSVMVVEKEITEDADSVVLAEKTKTSEDEPPVNIDSALYQYGKFIDMPYRILFPKNYDSSKSYPMLIFLHGIGERGNDNEKQLTWGASLFQIDSIREKYPAFVVFPQCKTREYWFDDWGVETLKGLADGLVADLMINRDKIYIGGLSMGAYGTYAMIAEYPDLFAAAIAISGDGDESKASVMAKTTWRIFAGKYDTVVPSARSEKMATALKRSGASVSFTLYAKADHVGSWVNAFAEPDFCSWLFSVSRGSN